DKPELQSIQRNVCLERFCKTNAHGKGGAPTPPKQSFKHAVTVTRLREPVVPNLAKVFPYDYLLTMESVVCSRECPVILRSSASCELG
ncbi:hypothetical protein HAX54_025023, partial [Datura stramonium]|nr:hypothetical protein [Datura stramonium]